MKLNAKLGGTTCKVPDTGSAKPYFPVPTMIIGNLSSNPRCQFQLIMISGADVSHPAAGSPQGSYAALTVSFDLMACRYAAAVKTNGRRIEMITEDNIKSMLLPLYGKWMSMVNGGKPPSHIYYFRDGVSEGQYAHVLDQEVRHMKKALAETFGDSTKNVSLQTRFL